MVICSDSCHSGTDVDRGDPPDDDLPAAKQLPMSVAIATEKAHQAEYDELQKKVPEEHLAAMAAAACCSSGSQFTSSAGMAGSTVALAGAGCSRRGRSRAPASRSDSLLAATATGIPQDYDQTPNLTVIGFDIGPALTI